MLAVLSCLVLFLSGCSKDGDDVPTPGPGGGGGTGLRTTVVGLVRDADGAPLSGASVSCGGATTTTDAAGAFLLADVATDSRCYVRAVKAGFFSGSAGAITKANGITRVRITLLSDAPVATFNGSSGTDTELSGGARVNIAANAVVDAGGNAVSGSVSLSMRHLDPEAEDFADIMPGGDLVAVGPDGDRQLQSFGMLMVRLADGGGNELQLAAGSTAQITLPVPPSLLGEAPATMPLWHYDESTGKWEEDGTATLVGGQYVGSVGHFSSWNCDLPFDRATVTGLVRDCNGDPVEGVTVKIGQAQAVTDAQGRYERFVPTGLPMTVQVNEPQLGLVSSAIAAGPFTDGQTSDIADLSVPCPAYVSLTLNCTSGAAVFGYATVAWSGGSTMLPFDAAGTYRIAVPANNASAELRVVHANGAAHETDVQLPASAGNTVGAGTFEVCPTGGGGGGEYGITFTLNGDGFNNQAVNISTNGIFATAVYSVPDDGTVGYATSAGASFNIGFPGNGTGSWTSDEGGGEGMFGIGINGQNYVGWNFTLTVTEYGAVGGHVRGTISGTAMRFDPVTFEMFEVQLSNGTFDLLRGPDEG